MRALLFAWMLSALEPSASAPGYGTLHIGRGDGEVVFVQHADGRPLASVTMAHDREATLRLRAGKYIVVDPHGEPSSIEIVEGETLRMHGDFAPGSTAGLPPPASVPPPPSPSTTEHARDERSQDARAESGTSSRPAWRAPLISTFVPGMGHAYVGRPLLGVGLLAATVGSTVGAVALAPELRSQNPSYARLGGFAALSSMAGLLYFSQIAAAHRAERGEDWEPHPGRVGIDLVRMSAVSMAPGSRRAALYDDFTISALVRVVPRVRVGVSDLGFKLGPSQTVIQGGVRGLFSLYGPTSAAPERRVELSAGAGAMLQVASRQRAHDRLDPSITPALHEETVTSGTPYALVHAEMFLTPRITAGVLGRYALPLAPRYYARGRTLPRWGSTFELGVSMGVRL